MSKIISCVLIMFLSLSLVANEAIAKRFGGGRSFGMRPSSSFFANHTKPQSSNFTRSQTTRKWGGMLGGMLVGGLLASLFMGHGVASGLLSWLVIGIIGFALINFIRQRMQPGYNSTRGRIFEHSAVGTESHPYSNRQNVNYNNHQQDLPADFIEDVFIREAKAKYIRLQTAFDQKNIMDLKKFTSPEVFAEIKLQLDERGEAINQTEVITLDAALLQVSTEIDTNLATVRFTGKIKEDSEPLTILNEIWIFSKDSTRTDWIVAGVHQQEMMQ